MPAAPKGPHLAPKGPRCSAYVHLLTLPQRWLQQRPRPIAFRCPILILPTSKVVKAFNHIHAAQLTEHGQPAGSENRRALVVAGDDADAKAEVGRLIDDFGFDTVDAGLLSESWRIEPGTPGYGPRRNAAELRADLAAATRPTPT